MAHNKGERIGLGRFIRDLTVFLDEKGVVVFRIDFDSSGGTDQLVAEAIAVSLDAIDKYYTKGTTKLWGVVTDTGGGGTTESCSEILKTLGKLSEYAFVGNCAMHAHLKCLENAFVKAFDSGNPNPNPNCLRTVSQHMIFECWSCIFVVLVTAQEISQYQNW